MPDPERHLLSRVAATGEVPKLLSMGIDERHFSDPACRDVWVSMVSHTTRYNAPPSFATLRELHPDFGFEITNDALDFIAQNFIISAKRRTVLEGMRDLAKVIDRNQPDEIAVLDELFLEKAREVSQLVPSSRVARFSDMDRRIQDYHLRKWSGETKGVPFGIDAIDRRTMGINPHEFVTVSGYSGRGKSTLLQWIFFNAYLAGKRPMLISLEMEAESLFRKWDTMAANFEYRALKAMELPDADLKKWEQWAVRAKSAANDIIVIDDIGSCTPQKVYAETLKYKPDIVGVDYVQLMEGKGGRDTPMWESVTYITKQLKANARQLKIPVVAVAQANRDAALDGANDRNVANSISILRDSDILLGLHSDEQMREQHQMQLRLVKNRDGAIGTTDLYWNMEKMQFGDWQTQHLFQGNE